MAGEVENFQNKLPPRLRIYPNIKIYVNSIYYHCLVSAFEHLSKACEKILDFSRSLPYIPNQKHSKFPLTLPFSREPTFRRRQGGEGG